MKLGKSFLYLAVTIGVGLLQLWLTIIYASIDKVKIFDFHRFFLDCGLAFFCTGLVATIATDYFFRVRTIRNVGVAALAYVLYPGVIILLGVAIYAVSILGVPDYETILALQIAMAVMSLIYCLFSKAIEFAKS